MRALWNIDLAFADVISTTLTTQLGAIRLAWWRERLEELDTGAVPPAEPRLQAVTETLIPIGISGAELSRLEYCWLALLSSFPWDDLVADAVAERGKILFGIGARILGQQPEKGEPFGIVWALSEVAEHCSDAESRSLLRDRARAAVNGLPRTQSELLPLTMLAFGPSYELQHGDRRGWHRLLWGIRSYLSGKVYP